MPQLNTRLPGVTIIAKTDGPITKRLYINGDGTVHNDSKQCRLWEGQAKTIRLNHWTDLVGILNTMPSHQALTLGVIGYDPNGQNQWGIVAKEHEHASVPGFVTRTQDHLIYQHEPGFMLGDYDRKGAPDLDDPMAVMLSIFSPGLGYIFRPSTSSGLSDGVTGATFADSGGFHLYLPVADVSDVPRALKVWHKRMWLAGYGWHIVGKRGALLERSLVDASVGGPERLIFEGAPTLDAPLVQDATSRAAMVVGRADAGVLDTRIALPDLADEEEARYADLVRASKAAKQAEADAVRATFAQEEAQRTGRDVEAIKADLDSADKGVLAPDHVLYFDSREIGAVTVADVMRDPNLYHEQSLADPMDPEDGRGKAKLYNNGNFDLIINSYAHGGSTWKLQPPSDLIGEIFAAAGAPDVVTLPPGVVPVNDMVPTTAEPIAPDNIQDLTMRPGFTHDGLAMELGLLGWNDRARFLTSSGKFLFWNGSFWEVDDRRKAFTLVRRFLRSKADRLEEWALDRIQTVTDAAGRDQLLKSVTKSVRDLRASNMIAAVHGLMQSNEGTAVTVDDLNTNLMKLGTPTGTVDLETGQLLPSDPMDLITRTTAVPPAEPGTMAPQWMAFLHRIMAGDQEMIAFLQRMAGYALTGMTVEHKFAFLYGTGRNGKGVYLNTLMGIMGDYSRKAPSNTFIEMKSAQHTSNIAGLHDARFVMGGELPDHAAWNETMLKDATGGDTMSAQFMRQDYFNFTPQFFLVIAGNTKPALRSVDQAIRDRLLLVPFTQYIPPHERDPYLAENLKMEWPAILRWAIDGCLQWQRYGLAAPAAVVSASEQYLDGEDFLGQFLNERCEAAAGEATNAKDFTTAYNVWRSQEGLGTIAKIRVQKDMEKRGYIYERCRLPDGTRPQCFIGVKMKLVKLPETGN